MCYTRLLEQWKSEGEWRQHNDAFVGVAEVCGRTSRKGGTP